MTLHEKQRQLFAFGTAGGVDGHRFANARLMSPQDVALATRSRTTEDQAMSGWWLCGDVHPGMWTAVRQGALFTPLFLGVAEAPSGRHYMTVVHQAGTWQHRLCIALVGSHADRWVETLLCRAPLQFAFAAHNVEHAFVTRVEFSPEALEGLRHTVSAMPRDIVELVDESRAFMTLETEAFSGLKLAEPEEICFSLLLPDGAQMVDDSGQDISKWRRAEIALG